MLNELIILCIGMLLALPVYPSAKCSFVTIEGICGTTEYAHHIGDAFKRRGVEVQYYHYEEIFAKEPELFIQDCLAHETFNIYLQHYFGWWCDDRGKQQWLCNLAALAKKKGIRMVATVHEDINLGGLDSKFLLLLDAVIMHREHFRVPLSENVFLIPHPVPMYDSGSLSKNEMRSKYGFRAEDRLITTTGFLNTQKMVPEILLALIPDLKKNKNLKLQLLCAAVVGGQFDVACRVRDIIKSSGCADQIYFDSNFLTQQEINERLFVSDLGFTWNSYNQNSGSGIEKQFISSRLPFIVNDCLHFDHCAGSASVPTDISLLVRKLTTLVYQDSELETLQNLLSEQYNRFNYDTMADTYAKIIGISLS